MKWLVLVVVFCSALLYRPYHLVNKSRTSVYAHQNVAERVTYIEKYTESLDKLLVGDIILFSTDPPHFASVGKQVDGELRELLTTSDSILTQDRDEFWVRSVFKNESLVYESSNRVIHPDANKALQSGEIEAVFRKKRTNFYYSPMFEGVFSIVLFFIFFFGLSLLAILSSWKKTLIGTLMVFSLAFYMSVLRYKILGAEYIMGAWNVRLCYWSVSIVIVSLSLYFVIRYANRFVDKYLGESLKFLAACVLAPASIFLSFKIMELVYPEITMIKLYEGAQLDKLTLWTHYYYGYAFALASLLAFGIKQYRSMKVEKEVAVSTQLNTTAQLNSLQARLNPHFLYNTLNSIASLIKTDPEKAEEMTLNVSKFMRHFSNRHSEHLTEVLEEVEMIKEYLEIEKIRFAERLEYVFEISDDAGTQSIPRSLLQPLVENAVKYGYSESSESISIRLVISFDDPEMMISIYDGGKDFDEALDKGYGLSSVYDKLSLLYGDAYDVSFTNHPDKHISISIQTDKLRMDD